MPKPKSVTIRLSTKQRDELKQLTGEDHAEVMFESVKTYSSGKIASTATLASKTAPKRLKNISKAALGGKAAPRKGIAKLGAKAAPRKGIAKLGAKAAPRKNIAKLGAKAAPRKNIAKLGAKAAPRASLKKM